ncbi:c-type cytochrome [Sphingomonas naphthae]|uniref:C-type cytochrome n=1 Tax=Sphingomonas naphthae TaxID=1813468 RepID=A0ABY7THP4_9SPHN|nr:c-type cytochrome [Sphingomonas naphthae]WCT72237.1 c-type cytochrome [Sphingomonas naphthae]
MTIRLTWKRIGATLLALALAGLAFTWSGLFNVAASTGHWAVTDWALHWVMRNSVRTHAALTAPADPRSDEGLVSAAGHFANACAVCHGAPGVRPSPAMQAATPPAPDLAINARQWSDKQLFWIIRHGVKYTGMPAWPADRPDEVRRMVAFVRRLPSMSPAEYRALTRQGPTPNPALASCAGCHGSDGRGRGQPDIPVLGGQQPAYLLATLRGYATGTRHSAVMRTAVAPLDDAELTALARHFAALPGLGAATPTENAAARRIVERGMPTAQLPACASCHMAGKSYPVIAGQRASYIANRLRQWRGDENVVDARKSPATMAVIARRIPEEMIDPLAAYLTGGSKADNRPDPENGGRR